MKYRNIKRYKYQLVESVTYFLPNQFKDVIAETDYIILVNNSLIIKDGYAWDGPSGPTFDSKDFMRGSLVHDVLYQLMREGWLDRKHRIDADKVLRDICLADGMHKFRASYVYHAVRIFCGRYALPRDDIFNKIIEI